MSYIDNIVIPFRRRDKRDLSLSRITTSSINLDSHYNFKALLLNPSFKKRKRNKSQFARNLLNEILPEIAPKSKTALVIKRKLKNRNLSSLKIPLVKNRNPLFSQLEEIPELDPSKRAIKRYEKNCNIEKHQISNKLISNFLTPVNNFISSKFRLNMEDYAQLTTQIKKRKGLPPRIPPLKKSFQLEELKI